jgi:fido (protein-threonine AMPylation protein)
MVETIKRALEYSLAISEDDPKGIKKNMEERLAAAGCDRRYKFKWRALCGNHRYTFSGIFEYAGQQYYFSKLLGEIELERI